jgi:G3E family GTPase
MNARTPVSIITGFLGSGKTTLLNRVLQDRAMAGALVIINEFGEIGLDHLLIATPNENTVLLASGCICCTVRGDLVDTLRGVARERQTGGLPTFDRVLIETTGLADPVPIMQTVVADEEIAPRFEMDGVVTLIDAVNGLAELDTQSEAIKQAAVADRLLLTKTDIAPASHLLLDRLAQLNAGITPLPVSHGDIAAAQLFGAGLREDADHNMFARWLPFASHTTAHSAAIQTHSVTLEEPVSTAGMSAWLTALASLRGANLLRVKGLLNVDGEPVAVHAVQTLIHEPIRLQRWPDAERRSRIVFITRGLARADVEGTLDMLRIRSQMAPPTTLDPQAYAQFVAAMKKMH